MKKTKKTITVYELSEGFSAEVSEKEEGFYEFYLNHDEHEFKMHMFSVYCQEDEIESFIIGSNIDTLIWFYKKELF